MVTILLENQRELGPDGDDAGEQKARPGQDPAFMRRRDLVGAMGETSQAGPWVLALGTLAIGIAALVVEGRRRREDDEGGGRDGTEQEQES